MSIHSNIYPLERTTIKAPPDAPQRRDAAETTFISGWWILPALVSGAGGWVLIAWFIFS